MVGNHFISDHPLYKKLSVFVSKIRGNRGKPALTLETLKTSRGLALVFISIILAWASVEASQSQATDHFQRTHWPKAKVWSQILSARGLSLQKNLGLFTKMIQSHPAPFSADSRIWVTEGGCAVYLPKSPYQTSPELWTCEPKDQPSKWTQVGSGLMGFEKLTDLFDKNPLKPKAKVVSNSYKIDPKEFRY